MLRGNPYHLFGIGQVVESIEQRLELLHRRHPEQRARRFVRLVEITVRNAARQAHQITGLCLHPDAIKLEIEFAFLNQDEFLLGWMDMDWHELAGVTVGLAKVVSVTAFGK